MTWTDDRLEKALEELWNIVGWPLTYQEKARVRRLVHCLTYDASVARHLGYMTVTMGIDEEILGEA